MIDKQFIGDVIQLLYGANETASYEVANALETSLRWMNEREEKETPPRHESATAYDHIHSLCLEYGLDAIAMELSEDIIKALKEQDLLK